MLKTKLPTVNYKRNNPETPEFFSDLEFDYNTRTNLNLIDRKAGEEGNIKDFVVGEFSGAEWIEFPVGGDYNNTDVTIGAFIKIENIDITQKRIIQKRGTGALGTQAGWVLYIIDQKITGIFDDGLGNSILMSGIVNLANDVEYFVYCVFDNVTGRGDLFIYNINTATLIDSATTIDANLIGVNFTTARKMSIGASWNDAVTQGNFWEGNVWGAWCIDRTVTPAEINELKFGRLPQSLLDDISGDSENLICTDVYSGIDSGGNNNHGDINGVTKGFSPFQRYLLDYGFQQYWDQATSLVSLQIPYDVNKLPIDPGDPYLHDGTNYDFNENHPEQLLIHNLAECFINFNPDLKADAKFDIWDRSNVTIQTAASRASIFYDASNPYTYHISELNQFTLFSFFNVGYAGKAYVRFETDSIGNDHRLYMIRIIVYKTDKRSLQEVKVLQWSGDIAHAIDDGSGGYLEDGNGYIILVN